MKSYVKTEDKLTNFLIVQLVQDRGVYEVQKYLHFFINDLISLESELNHRILVTTEISDLLGFVFADDVPYLADTVVKLQRLSN